jgi:hypothetical protein
MKKIYFLLTLLVISFSVVAQIQKVKFGPSQKNVTENAAQKSAVMQAEFIGFRNTPSVDANWRPYLATRISKNPSKSDELLLQIKEEKNNMKFSSDNPGTEPAVEAASQSTTPVINRNFNGIDNAGMNQPLDNTIAISNAGFIVTCVNARVEIRDANGAFLYGQTLAGAINDPSLSSNLCDPKIFYDSGADRFIFFVQTCDGLAATSTIVVGFSITNDPTQGFYFYKLTGNPLNNNCWFDYPKIGVSTNELYISGNLFGSNGGPYNQSVLYQIPKAPGFAGGQLNWQFWSGITGNPFTLMPLSNGHQGNYGPGIYLVASNPVTQGSTNLNVYDLTNDMSAPDEQLVHYNVATTNYSTGGDAAQLGGTKLLRSGDSRMMDGFYLNGTMHFVFHSDIGGGYNGINYNRLDIATGVNTSSTFGLAGTYDYCYPAVASIASSATDKSVLISYSRSGATVYPDVRVVHCDNNMTWSNSAMVRAGDSHISYSWNTVATERWGDYSGMSRKHNESPVKIWCSGDYANAQNYWGQWIAELSTSGSTGIINENNAARSATKVYPNPVVETYKVEFDLMEQESIEISIIDLQGKIVKELYNGPAQKGLNVFTFNKANLSTGTYFLQVNSKSKSLRNEKIIIANQ